MKKDDFLKEEDLKEYMLKEIDVIQSIINRMASNSFLIKGWAITLIVATLLLKGDNYQTLIAFVPLIAFWILDTFFLQTERKYRMLNKWVIKNRLKTDAFLLDMNTERLKKDKDYKTEYKVASIPKIMFSITLITFYGSILLIIIAYVIFIVSMQTGIIIF
ncbi:MAG: hypothetical protein KKF16_06415 [Euryarchaeota archaeon]|nr:hypothetical protein [Euryarchaeota archaeon]MBV1767488.1 hypothetical protein [Methanobacterium sp.]